LRAAQYFETFEVDKVAKRNTGARLIDAIDEYADRAFKTGIVAGRADAADLDRRALRFGLGRLDIEAGGDRR
jgi:hypothetical protein